MITDLTRSVAYAAAYNDAYFGGETEEQAEITAKNAALDAGLALQAIDPVFEAETGVGVFTHDEVAAARAELIAVLGL